MLDLQNKIITRLLKEDKDMLLYYTWANDAVISYMF